MSDQNREAWLIKAAERFKEGLFEPNSFNCDLSDIRVSVGFPPGKQGKTLPSVCLKDTQDKKPQIYINPSIDNSVEVLERLCIELVNACTISWSDDNRDHWFKKFGFAWKGAYRFANVELREELVLLAEELGQYPHSKVNLKITAAQKNRQVRCCCDECGFLFLTTKKWIKKDTKLVCPDRNCTGKMEFKMPEEEAVECIPF